MVTITYAPLGPQYGAMQSLHYMRDDAVWLNMIIKFNAIHTGVYDVKYSMHTKGFRYKKCIHITVGTGNVYPKPWQGIIFWV
jgi:hypothetical protein